MFIYIHKDLRRNTIGSPVYLSGHVADAGSIGPMTKA